MTLRSGQVVEHGRDAGGPALEFLPGALPARVAAQGNRAIDHLPQEKELAQRFRPLEPRAQPVAPSRATYAFQRVRAGGARTAAVGRDVRTPAGCGRFRRR